MIREQLDAAVKEYLNRPNLTAAVLLQWCAAVEGALNRALMEHPRNLRRAQFTQPADDPLLPLPLDVLGISCLYAEGVPYRQLTMSVREQALEYVPAFIARGDCLEVFPTPTQETVYYLDYFRALTPLETNVSENWVSKFFPDVYLYGMLKEGAVFLKDDARFQLWQTEWMSRVRDLRLQGWDQNIAQGLRTTQ